MPKRETIEKLHVERRVSKRLQRDWGLRDVRRFIAVCRRKEIISTSDDPIYDGWRDYSRYHHPS